MTTDLNLTDLQPLDANPRAHPPENLALITTALRRVGAARSGVIDEDNVLLAGNGTAQALAQAGITRVRVVEADGNEWVVVRRSGLSEAQKRLLTYFDNRAGDLAGWLAEEIVNDVAAGLNLATEGVFPAAEVERFIHEAAREAREGYDFLADPADPAPAAPPVERQSGPPPDRVPPVDPPAARGQAAQATQFALAIVLTRAESQTWQDYKRQVGRKDDKSAFLLLLAAVQQEGRDDS